MSKKIPDYSRPLTDEEEARYQAWLTKRRAEMKAEYEAVYGKDDEPCPYCDEYICECDD